MGISGTGPSRRSHTKSRTGCKTCKRRHIRCDETFPQCKNCTKHQVRCDYMDMVPAAATQDESSYSSSNSWLSSSPQIEARIEQWQQLGFASMGGFNINLRAQGHSYDRTDLLLIYHALVSATNPASHEYSVWSGMPPKFIKAAEHQPFLVHAINGFTCLGLAFETESPEAKRVAYQQGGIALQGLQQAINHFTHENADAVLAASILLSWQANDWHSWSSLSGGIPTVIRAMSDWKEESQMATLIAELESSIPRDLPAFAKPYPTEDTLRFHASTLNQIVSALAELQVYLGDREADNVFITRLKDYLQRLMSVRPPQTAEEQFNHLYAFRKWLFWIPEKFLRSETRDYMTLVMLAYLYSAALSLEPLYPNISAQFCSTMVIKPLQQIFEVFDSLTLSSFPSEHIQLMSSLLAYPRQVFNAYQSRKMMRDASFPTRRVTPLSLDRVGIDIGNNVEHFRDHRSPAFGQPPLSYVSTTRSSSESPYLEVPTPQSMLASHSGPFPDYEDIPINSAPISTGYDIEEDWATSFSSDTSLGFVQPQALWSY